MLASMQQVKIKQQIRRTILMYSPDLLLINEVWDKLTIISRHQKITKYNLQLLRLLIDLVLLGMNRLLIAF